jgi:hypothetical protein
MPIVIVRGGVRSRLDRGDFRDAIDVRIEGMHVKIAKPRGEVPLGARLQILILKEQDVTLGDGCPCM